MPTTAHMEWLWGMMVIIGAHTTLRMVRSSDRWSVWRPAHFGSPNAFSMDAGSETARATTSRTCRCDLSAASAARQSAVHWAETNLAVSWFDKKPGLPILPAVGRFMG